jgi:sulfide:quinone oxidoreductase
LESKKKKKEAIFQKTVDGKKEEVKVKYDILHVTPKQGTGEFLKKSNLVDADGFVDVNKNSLQSTKFPNIFSLGDASNIPTSKTAAAVTKQAPVVASNILNLIQSKPIKGSYDGYCSCALLTSNHEVMLAEFTGAGYGLQRKETFPVDQRKPRRSMFLLKRDVFPNLYWNGLVKGLWPPPLAYNFIGGFSKKARPAKTSSHAKPKH